MSETYTDAASANKALLALYESAANDECHVTGGRVRLQHLLPGEQLVVYSMKPDTSARNTNDIQTLGGAGPIYTASFLKELANLAGVSIIAHRRLDDRGHPHICEIGATARWLTLFCEQREIEGAYMLDLRDGSERTKAAASAEDLKSKRKHIYPLACTGAECRAIAGALDLRRGYRSSDGNLISLPIRVPRIRPCVETAPKGMLEEMARMRVSMLYGVTPTVAPSVPVAPVPVTPEPEPDFDDDPVPFDDGDNSWDEPPTEQDDREINEDERQYLRELGVSGRALRDECGWEGKGHPVRLSVYREAVSKFGGAGQ